MGIACALISEPRLKLGHKSKPAGGGTTRCNYPGNDLLKDILPWYNPAQYTETSDTLVNLSHTTSRWGDGALLERLTLLLLVCSPAITASVIVQILSPR